MTAAHHARRAFAVAVCAWPTVVLLPPTSAVAHSDLVRMEPADGAQLAAPPSSLRLHFSDGVQTRYVRIAVTGPGAQQLALGPIEVEGPRITQRLAPSTLPGKYLVAYRVISADGHPVSRQLSFTVTGGTASTPGASATTPRPATPTGAATAGASQAGAGQTGASPTPAGAQAAGLGSADGRRSEKSGGAAGWLAAGAAGLLLLGLAGDRTARRRRTAGSP